jgi:hypothetical protein
VKHFLCTVIILFAALIPAQEPATIRVKRESALVKAVFDNTQMSLMAIDRFGNPRENKIVSYKLYVKAKRETKEFEGYSNSLTGEMIAYLNKQPRAVKIFFTGITVRDENDHLLKLPDLIETWFPDCGNCEKGKGKRRDDRP